LFLLFVFLFCQVRLQQESILFGLLKVSQACLELVVHGPDRWWPHWWASRPVVRQQDSGLATWGWWTASSFSVLWHGENFHRLGVQDAEV
jgi:hypothetical protein